jgi:glucose uptake protein
MFVPHTFGIALLMIFTSAICWGSWANTYKGVKNYRFELFYWDYALGIFLIAVVLAFTMGSSSNDASSFLHNIRAADRSNFIYTLAGGAVFNLANLLLVAAIDMAGLAIAFPVSIGIAMVVGVVSSYVLQPKGNAPLIAAGVACAIIAVISIIVCVVSGILMGLWAPFVTHAMTQGDTLGPYSTGVFFTLGALLSCFVWNVYFMKNPLVGEPVKFAEFFSGPGSGHMLGLLGGLIWGTGTVFNLVAANFTGVAISYAIGQSAPMVAALWGVLAWKEFQGANRQAKTFLGLMFLFYILAILLIAKANTAG